MEPGGQFDMQQLFAAAAQVQGQFMSAQQRLAEAKIEGSAGGGLVKVTLDGQGELTDLVIAKEAIESTDPDEVAETVADLVLAACRDAYRALADVRQDAMGPITGGLLGGLGGLEGLGGLGGLGGAAGLPGFPGAPGAPDPSDGED